MSFICSTDKVKFRCIQTVNMGGTVERRYKCPKCATVLFTTETPVRVKAAGVVHELKPGV